MCIHIWCMYIFSMYIFICRYLHIYLYVYLFTCVYVCKDDIKIYVLYSMISKRKGRSSQTLNVHVADFMSNFRYIRYYCTYYLFLCPFLYLEPIPFNELLILTTQDPHVLSTKLHPVEFLGVRFLAGGFLYPVHVQWSQRG